MNGRSVGPEEREATPEVASDLHLSSVETMGLEPTTPCLQSRCSSQLSYVPLQPIVPPTPLTSAP